MPVQYVQQVVDFAWDCLRAMAKNPNGIKAYESYWLLQQFCIIYGLVVTELNLVS